jgi:hypothetical protein
MTTRSYVDMREWLLRTLFEGRVRENVTALEGTSNFHAVVLENYLTGALDTIDIFPSLDEILDRTGQLAADHLGDTAITIRPLALSLNNLDRYMSFIGNHGIEIYGGGVVEQVWTTIHGLLGHGAKTGTVLPIFALSLEDFLTGLSGWVEIKVGDQRFGLFPCRDVMSFSVIHLNCGGRPCYRTPNRLVPGTNRHLPTILMFLVLHADMFLVEEVTSKLPAFFPTDFPSRVKEIRDIIDNVEDVLRPVLKNVRIMSSAYTVSAVGYDQEATKDVMGIVDTSYTDQNQRFRLTRPMVTFGGPEVHIEFAI